MKEFCLLLQIKENLIMRIYLLKLMRKGRIFLLKSINLLFLNSQLKVSSFLLEKMDLRADL